MNHIRINLIITFIMALTAYTTANAQNMNDIYTLQNHTIPYGTPRFMGMGGAMGAVGGDVSSTYINPAGGAMAIKNEVSATLGVEFASNDALYYGNSEKTNDDANLSLFQAGANFVYVTRDDYTSFNSFSIGINYSRRSNFHNDYMWAGRNTTITDWVGGSPIGSSIVEETFRLANDGYETSAVYMAEKIGVISRYNDPSGDYYLPEAEYNDIDQSARRVMSGYSGVTTLSASMNIKNRFYIGLGFDFISLDTPDNNLYMDEWGFTHNDQLFHDGVSNLYYDRFTSQSGWGTSFTIGFIGKVTDEFRLGFSWKSAARYDIEEYYSYRMGAEFFDNTIREESDNPSYGGPNKYTFKSPSEWTVSAAYVFGQKGMLSVDYMLKDYSAMRFRDDPYFDYENQIIKEQMQLCQILRIGGELRLYPVSIRAGFNYITSPYKDVTVERVSQSSPQGREYINLPQGVGETMNLSMGIGVNLGEYFTVEATYMGSKYSSYQYLYSPTLTDAVKRDMLSHHIAIGATFRF